MKKILNPKPEEFWLTRNKSIVKIAHIGLIQSTTFPVSATMISNGDGNGWGMKVGSIHGISYNIYGQEFHKIEGRHDLIKLIDKIKNPEYFL